MFLSSALNVGSGPTDFLPAQEHPDLVLSFQIHSGHANWFHAVTNGSNSFSLIYKKMIVLIPRKIIFSLKIINMSKALEFDPD